MSNSDQTVIPVSAYRLENQIGFKLRLANQKHLELFGAMMPEATPTQFAILSRLFADGPLSQNHLGRRVGMDAATTKGVVDRLRSRGWVQSAPSKTDLRRLEISLTQDGKDFTVRAIEIAKDISAKTTKNLSTREAERLLALLDKL
ncbi:MarR family winged helix-turn-helix transcriptional regulator [Planktotalea sp.]|uniref:MarR family winged helix-turn-helix transcriptional regulator n=1 Tax=Planktotalea sp. TaxID=2029877 RepID=UPI003D6AFF6F